MPVACGKPDPPPPDDIPLPCKWPGSVTVAVWVWLGKLAVIKVVVAEPPVAPAVYVASTLINILPAPNVVQVPNPNKVPGLVLMMAV